MKQYVFLNFKKGDQNRFLNKSINKFGSIKKLAKVSSINHKMIFCYKHEIHKIPLERYKKICKLCNFKLKKINLIKKGWNKKEINFLKQNYLELTAKEIALRLNKTVDSVKHLRKNLGLYKGPKYRWNSSKKIISTFLELKKKLGHTLTYQECAKYNAGMLNAIHLKWGKYSSFLRSLGLDIKIIYWTKKNVLKSLEKLQKN